MHWGLPLWIFNYLFIEDNQDEDNLEITFKWHNTEINSNKNLKIEKISIWTKTTKRL